MNFGIIHDEEAFDFQEVDLHQLRGGFPSEIKRVWKSKLYVVRHYKYDDNERLSIDYTITELNSNVNMIRWDHLQKIKNSVGFEHLHAVELFPPEKDEIHRIEQRHLWLITEPDFGLISREKE